MLGHGPTRDASPAAVVHMWQLLREDQTIGSRRLRHRVAKTQHLRDYVFFKRRIEAGLVRPMCSGSPASHPVLHRSRYVPLGTRPHGRARPRASIVAHAIALLAAGCVGSTDPGKAGVPVVGAWRYAARQTSPSDADLTGTLTFTQQSGASVAGAIDVVETDARGQSRRLAGPLAGRTVDSTTVDVDVTLGAATRRHVGQVRGDSLVGTWIEQPAGGGAPSASGTFRAARTR